MSVHELRDDLRTFAAERDWNQFHTPKNLLCALMGEVGEVAELLQWKKDDEIVDLAVVKRDEEYRRKLSHELADVFAYLLRLSDSVDIDLHDALVDKMALNRKKYPVELCKGSSAKYDELKQAASSSSSH